MNVLFLPRKGVDLYRELLNSETSREALRFYRPVEGLGGVLITMATLGSGLSLVADLRWYVRRYMQEVLFEVSEGIFCTHQLAREIYYDRSVTLEEPWKFRRIYLIRDNRVVTVIDLFPGDEKKIDAAGGEIQTIEVWCSEKELFGIEPEQSGEPDTE